MPKRDEFAEVIGALRSEWATDVVHREEAEIFSKGGVLEGVTMDGLDAMRKAAAEPAKKLGDAIMERSAKTAYYKAKRQQDAQVGIGGAPTRATILPTDPPERKKYPMATGLLFYFPDALAVVSNVSWAGNEQHNPGQPLHWARSKSADQDDTIIRHLAQSGTRDSDGLRHTAKAAWRILAKLQLELEAEMENA